MGLTQLLSRTMGDTDMILDKEEFLLSKLGQLRSDHITTEQGQDCITQADTVALELPH